jgi:hypothetical protein
VKYAPAIIFIERINPANMATPPSAGTGLLWDVRPFESAYRPLNTAPLTTIGIPRYVTVNAAKNPKIVRIHRGIEKDEKLIGKNNMINLRII